MTEEVAVVSEGTEQVQETPQVLVDEATPANESQEQAQTSDGTDFINSVSEEYRSKVAQKGFKNTEDVLKAYNELESRLGKRIEDMTADELRQIHSKFGAPETPEGYEFEKAELPEGMEDELTSKYSELAHEIGLNKEQATKLRDWYLQQSNEAYGLQAASMQQSAQEQVEELKKEFGTAFDERVELAKDALNTYGGDAAKQAIINAGLANNPAIVKMLSEIGKLTSEAKPVGKVDAAQFGVTPDEAKQKIAELYKDKEFMRRWQSNTDPGHDSAVRQIEELYKLANPQ